MRQLGRLLKFKMPVQFGFVDFSQNIGFGESFSDIVPCLKKNTMIVSVSRKRMLLPVDHFCVNGIPLWAEGVREGLDALPVADFLKMSDRQCRHRAGNMMNLNVVGSIIESALVCTFFSD